MSFEDAARSRRKGVSRQVSSGQLSTAAGGPNL
jgi:hypothetical protein